MCDGLGRQFSYSCPNTTLFQQRMLICDHWYMVNCSKSELDYNANLLIGQRDKPFVEDSSEHPYHRTPRPDLLEQPYAPRYQDDAYRQGRAQSLSAAIHNLVGVATEDEDEDGIPTGKNYTTDRPQYFLPSHWSTEYGKGITTPLTPKTVKDVGKIQKTVPFSKNPVTNAGKTPPPSVQFDPKRFKVTKSAPPPLSTAALKQNADRKIDIVTNKVNVISRADSQNEASASPSTLALPPFVPKVRGSTSPPLQIDNVSDKDLPSPPSMFYEPPKLSSSINIESTTMDPLTFYKLVPSKELLPPVLRQRSDDDRRPNSQKSSPLKTSNPPVTTTTQKTVSKKDTDDDKVTDKTMTDRRWKELRQMFFIPEYDFPLEAGPRPSYESVLSSFQVNPAPPSPEMKFREGAQSSGPNAACPKCDPAFLVPGTCKPCVMIRR